MRASVVAGAVSLGVALAAGPSRAQVDGDGDQPVDVPTDDAYADTDPSALTDFRDALDPYGQWVDDPTYGMVWTPSPDQTGPGFEPYDTGGSWDYVDNDYTWVSDYAWGWVCFHYGRWAFSGGFWVWIPGRDYAGAWVSWRVGDDAYGYVGWAPLAPTWGWFGGVATAFGFASPEPWAFATYGDFLAPNVGAHAVTGSAAATVASHTRPYVPAQPTVGWSGPATPAPHGPPPAMLGFDASRLSFPPLGARENRARALARPSTAVPLGARAPVRHVLRAAPRPGSAARGGAIPARAAAPRGRR
jgi:hypothetical protein